jgi:hypothetical protein
MLLAKSSTTAEAAATAAAASTHLQVIKLCQLAGVVLERKRLIVVWSNTTPIVSHLQCIACSAMQHTDNARLLCFLLLLGSTATHAQQICSPWKYNLRRVESVAAPQLLLADVMQMHGVDHNAANTCSIFAAAGCN